MTIPLQFVSLYHGQEIQNTQEIKRTLFDKTKQDKTCNGQEVFVWSDCLLDLGTDFLDGNMVFV